MPVRDILLLGNPKLYETCAPVELTELESLKPVITDLHDTMMDFRKRYNRGRAIAAPQIGVMKRLIYMHIEKPVVFINPIFKDNSDEMMVVWDDCMSFPDLLVKVRRHKSCTIEYKDMDFNEQQMQLVDDLSELLQHEYDHLDGILAVSRAIDPQSLALESQKNLLTTIP
jgi:peptide deformylase